MPPETPLRRTSTQTLAEQVLVVPVLGRNETCSPTGQLQGRITISAPLYHRMSILQKKSSSDALADNLEALNVGSFEDVETESTVGTRRAEIAAYAETRLPRNAVLLVELNATERRSTDEHLRLMFLMSKTAHPFRTGETWKEKAAQIHKAGGIPYIVSFSTYSLPVVFTSRTDKRTLYSISEELTDETP